MHLSFQTRRRLRLGDPGSSLTWAKIDLVSQGKKAVQYCEPVIPAMEGSLKIGGLWSRPAWEKSETLSAKKKRQII
jgi:hypothetical protein